LSKELILYHDEHLSSAPIAHNAWQSEQFSTTLQHSGLFGGCKRRGQIYIQDELLFFSVRRHVQTILPVRRMTGWIETAPAWKMP
jgi:hypothetical protein